MKINHKFWLAVLGLAIGLAPAARASEASDAADLRRINEQYQRAFLASDAAWYRQLLADDFEAVLADGRVIDKTEFLREAAQPPRVSGFWREEPQIRLYGDAAVVVARIGYRHANGAPVQTRYVGVYVRRDNRWRMESVQFTRIGAPP